MLPGSVIIKGKSLNTLQPKKAGLPGLHRRGSSLLQHPLQALRGRTNAESRSSALRNDNFPTILEAEQGGPGGKLPAPTIKYKFLLLISGKKSPPAVSTGAWGRKRELGCLRNVCVYSGGKMFLHLLMEKKSLQDT